MSPSVRRGTIGRVIIQMMLTYFTWSPCLQGVRVFYPTTDFSYLLPTYTTYLIAIQMSKKEGQIVLAIDAYNKGHFTSLKAACTLYDAPYSTIRGRINRAISQRDFRPKNQKLIDLEESTLI
jgi:hypothetical protein